LNTFQTAGDGTYENNINRVTIDSTFTCNSSAFTFFNEDALLIQ